MAGIPKKASSRPGSPKKTAGEKVEKKAWEKLPKKEEHEKKVMEAIFTKFWSKST